MQKTKETNGNLPDATQRDEVVDLDVEYVSEQLDVKDTTLEAFSDVFARFQLPRDEYSVRPTFFQ
jgi:splicing factor 3B subunit 2